MRPLCLAAHTIPAPLELVLRRATEAIPPERLEETEEGVTIYLSKVSTLNLIHRGASTLAVLISYSSELCERSGKIMEMVARPEPLYPR